MTPAPLTPKVLHADQEHSGIRTAVLIVLVIAMFLSFQIARFILRALVPESEFIGLLSCLTGLPIALGIVWVVEQGLKRVWHSGRNLKIDEEGIRVREPGIEDEFFEWSDSLTYLSWAFSLSGYPRGGHERRVPKKWLCLSCQLQQDDLRLTVYALLSPPKASALLEQSKSVPRFHRLRPGDVYDNSLRSRIGPPLRPTIPAEVLAGQDGKYWLAERRRWNEGMELTAEDFEFFLRSIHAQEASSSFR